MAAGAPVAPLRNYPHVDTAYGDDHRADRDRMVFGRGHRPSSRTSTAVIRFLVPRFPRCIARADTACGPAGLRPVHHEEWMADLASRKAFLRPSGLDGRVDRCVETAVDPADPAFSAHHRGVETAFVPAGPRDVVRAIAGRRIRRSNGRRGRSSGASSRARQRGGLRALRSKPPGEEPAQAALALAGCGRTNWLASTFGSDVCVEARLYRRSEPSLPCSGVASMIASAV